jgi:prephenate dehydrogenase
MNKPFAHVVIVGCGLLGTSLGLALRRHRLAGCITGVGRPGSPSVTIAQARGAVDRIADDLAAAVAGTSLGGEDRSPASTPPADLVVVCTPVREFPVTFRTMAPVLAPGTLVTDVASTKQLVARWAAELLPGHVRFVGSHPMAGSEKTGPQAARDDLYVNATCLICPAADGPATARVAGLWQAMGMRTVECTADVHDQWVAAVSHLPHAIAFSLINAAGHDPDALNAAAGGFIDMTRIASSDATMWVDIFLTNRQAVVGAMDRFLRELGALKTAIASGDEGAIRAALTAAKATRDQFLVRRQTQSSSSRGKS